MPALIASASTPPRLSIAAAANFVPALASLNAAFTAANPDVVLTVASGASGSLVAQITHGAPFDIFLSADPDYPRALVTAGHAATASISVFARGRLVLWTTRDDVPLESLPAALRARTVKKIAIAHIDTAPYGRAAQQALQKLGAWHDALPKIVIGENIAQTAQFVETGNADIGFVALSLVLAPKLTHRGRWLEVPAELHVPLDHAAVLTTRGAKNPAATRYLAFLRSPPAREILTRFGYDIPRSSVSN